MSVGRGSSRSSARLRPSGDWPHVRCSNARSKIAYVACGRRWRSQSRSCLASLPTISGGIRRLAHRATKSYWVAATTTSFTPTIKLAERRASYIPPCFLSRPSTFNATYLFQPAESGIASSIMVAGYPKTASPAFPSSNFQLLRIADSSHGRTSGRELRHGPLGHLRDDHLDPVPGLCRRRRNVQGYVGCREDHRSAN